VQNVCFAQPLQFTTLTIDNGLNVNSINGIMQDKNGFIWMTTSDGVCRYDGRNFKKMLFDKNKPNSLNSYVYTSIIEDNNGNIWIDGENGVETIDGKSGQVSFVKIEKQNNNVFYFGPDFFVLKNRNTIARVSVNYTVQIFDERGNKFKKR
jgi:ligand-binding sensor domain-containing protein